MCRSERKLVQAGHLVIRPAKKADFSTLARLEESAARRFLDVADLTGMTAEQVHDTLDTEELSRALSHEALWIAEWESEPAGFLAAHLYPSELYIREVDVLRRFGRRGIGTALVQRAVERARGAECERVVLRTFRCVAWNEPFYHSLGFREVERASWSEAMFALLQQEDEWGLKPEKRLFMALSPSEP